MPTPGEKLDNSRDKENYIYQKWEIPSGTGGAERPDTIPY